MPDYLRLLTTQASIRGTKSTEIQPLLWLFGLLVVATLASAEWGSLVWIVIAMAVAAGIVLLLIIGVYLHLLFKRPDSLRSERFVIRKMEIERGLLGDNLVGTSRSLDMAGPKVIEAAAPKIGGGKTNE